ncbi:hypothetical protein D3C81_2121180 [compost metagenome]
MNNPVTDWNDQTCLLKRGKKFSRQQHAALGVVPAKECFKSGQRMIACGIFRLIP